MRFSTVQVSTGPRLHYAEFGQADGDPMLFLHRWPESWFSHSRVVPLLPARFHAFVPDQRGFGDSARPERGYTIDHFAADAVAFLNELSIERATIVGHSFGSFVARRVAISHPERVTRLALIGTGESGGTPVVREVQQSMADTSPHSPSWRGAPLANRALLRPS